MDLFHKFQSRQFQFALELFNTLSCSETVTDAQIAYLARKCGLEYADQCLPWLLDANLLEKIPGGVRCAEGFSLPSLPPSNLETEYLYYILSLPEANLFLSGPTIQALKEALNPAQCYAQFQQYRPKETMPPPDIPAEQFQLLLTAIRQKRWLHYEYRTSADPVFRPGNAVPWKLEYDAFDHRWWIILYDPDQNRTVKSILGNLRSFRMGKQADLTDEQIEIAMERLLAPESIILRISPQRNALERCAMVFERQMLQKIQKLPDGDYQLSFRYHQFDEQEILGKLLYLGPSVQLISPRSMCKKLLDQIEIALSQNTEL